MMRLELQSTGLAEGLQVTNDTGDTLQLDAGAAAGGDGKTFRPMQTLLAALMGCSAIDVLLILEKQRTTLEQLHVTADAERREEAPRRFTKIHLHFAVTGDCSEQQFKRAVDLSVEKYCSVSASLHPDIELSIGTVVRPLED
ncbi:MAG: OsmC family protein [Bacteroidota bacterium]